MLLIGNCRHIQIPWLP